MSRSKKRHPGYYITTGDRAIEKRKYNRRWRRKNKVLVHVGSEILIDKHDEVADPWDMVNDGPYYFDNTDKRYYRK